MITNNSPVDPVASLADAELTRGLVALAGRERELLVDFLRHLAEFDARELYLALGYPSLYVYCRDGLKLSDGSAFRRYTAARLLARFPAIADFLRDGRLTLARVARLREVLTEDNHLELLNRATAGSERDVEVLAATLRPRPDVTDTIRKVTSRTVTSRVEVEPRTSRVEVARGGAESVPQAPPEPGSLAASAPRDEARTSSVEVAASAGATADGDLFGTSRVEVRATRANRMEVEATSATAFSVRMRVGPEFLAEFEAVKAALSHKVPDGNFEAVLRECFRITLEACERRRAAATRRCGTGVEENAPRRGATALSEPATPFADRAAPPPRSRYIPARVRRAVWRRDEGRCAFVSADGRRCDSRHQLEFHHVDPFALGGPSTEENLSLRCRQHNAWEGEQVFGPSVAARKRCSPRPGRGGGSPTRR